MAAKPEGPLDVSFRDRVLHVRELMTSDYAPNVAPAQVRNVIQQCDKLIAVIEGGDDADEVAWLAFELGMAVAEIELDDVWSRELGRSRKMVEGARAGGKARRKMDPRILQAAVDDLQLKHPAWSHARLSENIAISFGISKRSVQRLTRLK